MQRSTDSKTGGHRLLMRMSMLTFCLYAVGIPIAMSDEWQRTSCADTPALSSATAAEGQGEKAASTPEGSAGMRVYRDPKTGRFEVPPADASAAEALPPSPASSTSHEGLVETPSPVPGGGILIDLQGRFRSSLKATIDPNGHLTIEHAH